MSYYIGTYKECKDYDSKVSKSEGYVNGDNWASIHLGVNNCAILTHEKYKSALECVEVLPDEFTIKDAE